MLRLFRQHKDEQERRDELLSAYLDDELSEREQARLEARLAEDPDLRAELKELRHTVSLMHDLPSIRAPRNFILSRSMAEQKRPAPSPRPSRAWLAPALTAASTVVSLLFIVVMIGDLLLPSASRMALAPSAGETPEAALSSAPVEKTVEVEQPEAAPLVTPAPQREGPSQEEGIAADKGLSAGEATRAAQAPAGAGGTSPPAALGGEESPTQTVAPTVAPKATLTPTIPPEPTPTAMTEKTATRRELREREPAGSLPWRALEIGLGLAALGLTFATIRAWRARRR